MATKNDKPTTKKITVAKPRKPAAKKGATAKKTGKAASKATKTKGDGGKEKKASPEKLLSAEEFFGGVSDGRGKPAEKPAKKGER